MPHLLRLPWRMRMQSRHAPSSVSSCMSREGAQPARAARLDVQGFPSGLRNARQEAPCRMSHSLFLTCDKRAFADCNLTTVPSEPPEKSWYCSPTDQATGADVKRGLTPWHFETAVDGALMSPQTVLSEP